MESSIVIPCRLALERPGLKTETSARHWSKLYACCSVVVPRMPFSWRYTLSTPLVEGADKVSKSVTTVATFWIALEKVGHDVPSWLMVAAMAWPELGP
jgi:hypothetical protein